MSVIDQPIYACPFCPVPFFSKVGRDDHIKYHAGDGTHPEVSNGVNDR